MRGWVFWEVSFEMEVSEGDVDEGCFCGEGKEVGLGRRRSGVVVLGWFFRVGSG